MARRDPDPRPIADVLGAVGRDLGADDPRSIGAIASGWEEILGPELAPHVRFVSLRDGVLVLVHPRGRDLARHDPAEHAIGHRSSLMGW